MDNENMVVPTVPPKSCLITVMFPIASDDEAMAIKKAINEALKDVKEKRFTFQINER